MADVTWIESYSNPLLFSADELRDEIDKLKGDLSIFSAQSLGSKSFQRDLEALKNRLNAAGRALQDRGGPSGVTNSGSTDFSGVCVS